MPTIEQQQEEQEREPEEPKSSSRSNVGCIIFVVFAVLIACGGTLQILVQAGVLLKLIEVLMK